MKRPLIFTKLTSDLNLLHFMGRFLWFFLRTSYPQHLTTLFGDRGSSVAKADLKTVIPLLSLRSTGITGLLVPVLVLGSFVL